MRLLFLTILRSVFHDDSRALRVFSSLVIVIFFTLYTSAGIVAGGKLFEASFGLNYQIGLVITAGVVVAYTMFGGFPRRQPDRFRARLHHVCRSNLSADCHLARVRQSRRIGANADRN